MKTLSRQDSSDSISENAGSSGRTVATKEQRIILSALHERSRGRVTKEDVELVSEQTGLYVAEIGCVVLTIPEFFVIQGPKMDS